MKISAAPFLDTIHSFSLNSSLHGIAHLFTNRSYRAKQCWMLTIITISIVFAYSLILTGQEHFIREPTVTAIKYNSRKSAKLPKITICPRLLSHSDITNEILSRNYLAALHTIVGYLHYNVIYSDVRRLISENISDTFIKYSRLEHTFELLEKNFELDFAAENGT